MEDLWVRELRSKRRARGEGAKYFDIDYQVMALPSKHKYVPLGIGFDVYEENCNHNRLTAPKPFLVAQESDTVLSPIQQAKQALEEGRYHDVESWYNGLSKKISELLRTWLWLQWLLPIAIE